MRSPASTNLSYGKPSQSPRLSASAAIAPEAMLLPRITSQQPNKSRALPTAGAQRHTSKIVQAGATSGLVLAIGIAGIAMYREVERYLDTAKPGTDQPLPVTFSLKNYVYQRLPRPGTYYDTTSLSNQSRREISSINGRFCVKLVNAAAKASAVQQIIVSTLTLRNSGIYIDATRERLQIDNTFTEVTDSKSTWQWSKAEVDRAGLVAECLASTTSYVRKVKGIAKN